MAPEHRRLRRYQTMSLSEICSLPVGELAGARSHLYLWVPNALLPDGRGGVKGVGLHLQN